MMMTREEAVRELEFLASCSYVDRFEPTEKEALKMAIDALKQEPKTEQFAKWVATEIFDDMWEYNYEAFAEIACRKLSKLGIVVRMGGEWVLVESQESER